MARGTLRFFMMNAASSSFKNCFKSSHNLDSSPSIVLRRGPNAFPPSTLLRMCCGAYIFSHWDKVSRVSVLKCQIKSEIPLKINEVSRLPRE